MKKIVHKSPIPLYAAAVTCLLYALLFPLYRVSDFLLAAAATVVVGVVARLFCPNTVEEVEEAPQPTGNEELDRMIDQGDKALKEMQRLDDAIADETISAQIVRLRQLSGRIFDQVKADPAKLPQIRKFMDYYLPTTLKLLSAYNTMSAQGVSGENIDATMHKVESMMSTIVTAFEKQLDSLFSSEALDISTDMTVLENMMAREGLTEDMLRRTTKETSAPAGQSAPASAPQEAFSSGTAVAQPDTKVDAGDITLEL